MHSHYSYYVDKVSRPLFLILNVARSITSTNRVAVVVVVQIAHCLKQIAQVDLENELSSINTKIDNLQFGGMTVQQSAVLQIGTNANGVADSGVLRVEAVGSIEVMLSGGKIDVKTGGVLDVSGATVLGLGGSASSDAVSIGYVLALKAML